LSARRRYNVRPSQLLACWSAQCGRLFSLTYRSSQRDTTTPIDGKGHQRVLDCGSSDQ
jgi:hypothetical protein